MSKDVCLRDVLRLAGGSTEGFLAVVGVRDMTRLWPERHSNCLHLCSLITVIY